MTLTANDLCCSSQFLSKFFQYCSFSRIEYCEMVFCVQVRIDVVHDVELHVLTLLCLLWGEVSHPGSQTANVQISSNLQFLAEKCVHESLHK